MVIITLKSVLFEFSIEDVENFLEYENEVILTFYDFLNENSIQIIIDKILSKDFLENLINNNFIKCYCSLLLLNNNNIKLKFQRMI